MPAYGEGTFGVILWHQNHHNRERPNLTFPSTLGSLKVPLRKYLNSYFPSTCYILAHYLAKGQFPAFEGCRHPRQGWGRAGLLHAHGHCVSGRARGSPQRSLLPSAFLLLCSHQQTHGHRSPSQQSLLLAGAGQSKTAPACPEAGGHSSSPASNDAPSCGTDGA